jgi:hypothetical protein
LNNRVTLHIFSDEKSGYQQTKRELDYNFPFCDISQLSGDDIANNYITVTMATPYWMFDLKTADINADGTDDFIITCYSRMAIFDGKTFALMKEYNFATDHPNQYAARNGFYARVATGDINNDGTTDLVAVCSSPKHTNNQVYIHVFLNDKLMASGTDLTDSREKLPITTDSNDVRTLTATVDCNSV